MKVVVSEGIFYLQQGHKANTHAQRKPQYVHDSEKLVLVKAPYGSEKIIFKHDEFING